MSGSSPPPPSIPPKHHGAEALYINADRNRCGSDDVLPTPPPQTGALIVSEQQVVLLPPKQSSHTEREIEEKLGIVKPSTRRPIPPPRIPVNDPVDPPACPARLPPRVEEPPIYGNCNEGDLPGNDLEELDVESFQPSVDDVKLRNNNNDYTDLSENKPIREKSPDSRPRVPPRQSVMVKNPQPMPTMVETGTADTGKPAERPGALPAIEPGRGLGDKPTNRLAERMSVFVQPTTVVVTEKPVAKPRRIAVPTALADQISAAFDKRKTVAVTIPEMDEPPPMVLNVAAPAPQIQQSWPLSPDDDQGKGGNFSEDCLSDGGEFYDNDELDFMKPSAEVLQKSIPIVPSQKHSVREKKGYLFKYTNQKGTISKLGSQWQKRWVTVDSDSLKYFSTNKSHVSKRVIPVSTMVNLEQDIRTNEVHPFRFRLKTVDRFYRFAADTSDDLALWSSILMHAIIGSQRVGYKLGGDMNSPNMEGFAKMDGVRGKRYLAIKNGKFCFYNTNNDFRGFSPIHQVELQLASVKDIGKCKLQVQTPQVPFIFIFESQDDVNAWKAAFETGISYALGDNKVLDEVYGNTENKYCADCRLPGPEWAAVNMGITLCQNCAGIHRTLINAKVRSLRMDSKVWKPPLIQLMKVIGNANANEFWEWSMDKADFIDSDVDVPARTQFINAKYKEKRFCNLHQLHNNLSALNELLCKCVQQSDVLETMQIVFSGADVTYTCKTFGGDAVTPYQLAEEARQTLQMEFLMHNGGDLSKQPQLDIKTEARLPSNNIVNDVSHSGYLLKAGPNVKLGFNKRWCVLQNGVFSYLDSDKNGADVKDTIERREMLSVSHVVDERMQFAFELATNRQSSRSYLLAAATSDERQEWMLKLAMCISPISLSATPSICHMTRGSVAYVKLSMTQEWIHTWLHLCGKTLYVGHKGQDCFEEIDIRKAMTLKYLPPSEKCVDSFDNGPPLFLDLPVRRPLYIQGEVTRETEGWFTALQKAMLESSSDVSSQALTADNIPVIIDKLVTFVSCYGMQTEGIYRHSAQQSVVTKVLELFATGSRSVCLRSDDFTVHDIANALKRFLRNLDDSLLMRTFYARWIEAAVLTETDAKLTVYKRLLAELPVVNYFTLKHLIFHLVQVAEQESATLMNVSNLARTFGPVLLFSDMDPVSSAIGPNMQLEICVIQDLLEHHRELFQIKDRDVLQAQQMTKMARLISQKSVAVDQSPDDIIVPIYIGNREGKSVNVKVSPAMPAGEVLLLAIEKAGMKETNDYVLQEVVVNDELERPIHSTESVTNIVLRWGRWPEEFCRSNYLVVKPFVIYQDIFKAVSDPHSTLSCELKYAPKKTFSKCSVEFSQNWLTCRKDKTEAGRWNIAEVIIYLGMPVKKSHPSPRCGFTMISAKDPAVSQYFGQSIACSSDKELYRWLAVLLIAQHPDGLWSTMSSC